MLPGFARQKVNAIVRDTIHQYPAATKQNQVHWIFFIFPHTANNPKRNAERKSFESFPWKSFHHKTYSNFKF